MERAIRGHVRLLTLVVAAIGAGAALSACSGSSNDPDLIAGKQLFVEKCGSCHTLSRAGTKGTVGPNLDEAFRQSKSEGFGESAIRGVVAKQIEFPYRGTRPCSPACARMPADLVTGHRVHDVAAYVAQSAAESGQDTGLLATAVKSAGGGKPAAEKGGVLSIAADPGGQLAYVTKTATATAGTVEIQSPNKSSTVHDIVIAGKGEGKEVSNGGVSEFKATFAPGKYTYYCSLPGHRQAGMQGTLTVK